MEKTGIVAEITAGGAARRRIMDLGFVEGTKVKPVRRSPTGDPTAYLIRETLIALRREEASQILVADPY